MVTPFDYISAIGSAFNMNKYWKEENKAYKNLLGTIDTQANRSIFQNPSAQALLKTARQDYKDNIDAMQNRAAAGGATVENQLAARQANNEAQDRLYASLLQGEDARRDRFAEKKMQADLQHSANIQNKYYQNAQNWSDWGQAMGKSIDDLTSTAMLLAL